MEGGRAGRVCVVGDKRVVSVEGTSGIGQRRIEGCVWVGTELETPT